MKKAIIVFSIVLSAIVLYYALDYYNIDKKIETNSAVEVNNILDISTFKQKITDKAMNNLPSGKELSGYGLRMFDENGNFIGTNNIICNSNKYRCYISLVNANEYEEQVGFMLILDNKIKEFCVDGNQVPQTFYTSKLTPYSMINIPIEFSLEGESEDIVHNICAIYLYGMDRVPSSELHIPYFVMSMNKSFTYMGGGKAADFDQLIANNKIASVDKEFANLRQYVTVINTADEEQSINQNVNIKLRKGQNVEFVLKAFNQKEHLYSTIVFFDNIPIKINNNDKYLIWKSSEDKMLVNKFSFQTPQKAGIYSMYSISIPLNNIGESFIMTSEKIDVEVIE